jgi:hypothetical protein
MLRLLPQNQGHPETSIGHIRRCACVCQITPAIALSLFAALAERSTRNGSPRLVWLKGVQLARREMVAVVL